MPTRSAKGLFSEWNLAFTVTIMNGLAAPENDSLPSEKMILFPESLNPRTER